MSLKERLSALVRDPSRRSFLQACGVLGLGLGGALATDKLLGRGVWRQADSLAQQLDAGVDGPGRLRSTRVAMGTFVTITAIDPSNDRCVEAVQAAFAEIARLEALLSRHDSRSPLSLLNERRSLRLPPPELAEVLRYTADVARGTRGAFEPTVAPVIDVLRALVREGGLIDPSKVFDSRAFRDAVARIDPQALRIERSRVELRGHSSLLTLDGIAKGYIVDRAALLLQNRRVGHFMIDAGGDIRVFSRARRKAWTIAVEDPNKRGHYPDVIRLDHGAVATSGSYEVFFDPGQRLHHLIDPHSGRPATGQRSVTTIASSVMLADALSTALFVASPAERRAIVRHYRGIETLAIASDGTISTSTGWSRHSLRRPA